MHWIAWRCGPEAQPRQAVADPLTALAWRALQYTPLVAQVDDALVLEVSASERLFGGRSVLLARIFESNVPLTPMYYAQGATSLVALGRLWSAAHVAPDALPVHTLAAARAHLPTLARLGVRTWGQLRALPRGGVVRRFGAALVDALDRAYGAQPEVYPWLTLPQVFDAPLELQASVESAPALLFGARRLLEQLLVWLRARQHGVLVLELLWELDARRSNTQHVDAHHAGGQQGRLVLHTAQATQDMAHLQRLLTEKLAQVTLPAPVLYLRLRTLQTQLLGGESHSLLPEDIRNGDSLHQMLERLGARLGSNNLLCAVPRADHRPEHMQRWQPWTPTTGLQGAIKSGAARAIPAGAGGLNDPASLCPGWLLPLPQRLAVHQGQPQYLGPLTLLAGPQRLEAGWLDGEAALRDYYLARSPRAGLVWIYAQRLGEPAWYLQGLFG
jgi:protein ImuB